MRNGVCPKCKSTEIYHKSDGIRTGIGDRIFVSVSWWSKAMLDNYVCTNCGHVESYIPEARDLADIARKWDRVERQG